ncbi:hypothetical protein F2Q69_00004757 [Brassica cretica]|uniref:Uncharacterized protein n=1 Tax=Brassica cretica TaxID=69181 RepID=A0A8S9PJ80_BRACR|nr:hypothetical protein F2Q69_00004757 [Brassica cretica]
MTTRKKRSGKEKAKEVATIYEERGTIGYRPIMGFPLVLQFILAEVLKAEHDPQLIVQHVIEYGEHEEDVWKKFDCEIFNRKVANMVELLKAGNKYRYQEWGYGDAAEPKFNNGDIISDAAAASLYGPPEARREAEITTKTSWDTVEERRGHEVEASHQT